PKSSSSYFTSIDCKSETISLKIDKWFSTEPPSCNLCVNNFIFMCILLVRSLDMQIDSSFSQRADADFS
uniref:Uncharacterized protein n=1 Tax=Triticum urartu TaxID=4572 RepID=A0A8R7QNN5_TRIUA